MSTIVPTQGRIVLYTMTVDDARIVNARRRHAQEKYHLHQHQKNGTQLHVGNEVVEGEVYPAMVVRAWGNAPDSYVNLKVELDGNDVYWATSRKVEEAKEDGSHTPGYYHWMDYQKGQAAKTEAVEALLGKKHD